MDNKTSILILNLVFIIAITSVASIRHNLCLSDNKGPFVAAQVSVKIADKKSDKKAKPASKPEAKSESISEAKTKKIPSKNYTVKGKKYKTLSSDDAKDYTQKGTASWYGPGFHGKKTANGETYNQNAMTAAHKTLPLSSVVKVTNTDNNKSITVIINDRGPYHGDRVIDLSKKAAKELDILDKGTGNVVVQVIS